MEPPDFTQEQKSQLMPFFEKYRKDLKDILYSIPGKFNQQGPITPTQLTLTNTDLKQENLIDFCRQSVSGLFDVPLDEICQEEGIKLDPDLKVRIVLPYQPIFESESLNLEKMTYSAKLCLDFVMIERSLSDEPFDYHSIASYNCFGFVSGIIGKYEDQVLRLNDKNLFQSGFSQLLINIYKKLLQKIKDTAPEQYAASLEVIKKAARFLNLDNLEIP